MTSASGCLLLTIPKTIRRTRAEAGLRRGNGEVRARKSRELWGLWAAQCETNSQLALGTGTKRVKAMFLLPQWCLGLRPCTSGCRERVSTWLEGDLHPFLHTSKSSVQPLCPVWKGKSGFPGYLHRKRKAFSMTFLGMPGTPVACLYVDQGTIQPMKELPGDCHPHYWFCKGPCKERTLVSEVLQTQFDPYLCEQASGSAWWLSYTVLARTEVSGWEFMFLRQGTSPFKHVPQESAYGDVGQKAWQVTDLQLHRMDNLGKVASKTTLALKSWTQWEAVTKKDGLCKSVWNSTVTPSKLETDIYICL